MCVVVQFFRWSGRLLFWNLEGAYLWVGGVGGWAHQSGWDGGWGTGEGAVKDFRQVCAVGTMLARPGGVRLW